MVSFIGARLKHQSVTQVSENQFCLPISEKSWSLYFNPMRRENENPHAGQGAKEAKPR